MDKETKSRVPALTSRFVAQSQSLKRALLLLDQEAKLEAGNGKPDRAGAEFRRNLCPGGFSCPHCEDLP